MNKQISNLLSRINNVPKGFAILKNNKNTKQTTSVKSTIQKESANNKKRKPGCSACRRRREGQ